MTLLERRKYQTRQQEAVQALFQAEPALCLTAEEIYLRLKNAGLEVGKTTVYRAVSRLCEDAVLRRYAPHGNGDAACYQLNNCGENHLHIRCLSCGELAHLGCEEVREFCRHIASHHGYVLAEGQTILYGHCEDCSPKQEDQL